ncbi:hypothetical protein FS749_014054 [Ceratobasidium sp. UAMH 11750]|nr:hypothetical protein FS749_014054 [Ceratobasidium sp. UAMH 11750]
MVNCESCKDSMLSRAYDQHCRTKRHISRQLVFNYLNAVALTQCNRNGVDVSGDESGLDLGVWTPTEPTSEPVVIHISNTLATPVSLIKARTSASLGVRLGLQLHHGYCMPAAASRWPQPVTAPAFTLSTEFPQL